MGSAPNEVTDAVDRVLIQNGHEPADPEWLWDGRKKQCPECYGLHAVAARECAICGWAPHALSSH